MIRAVIVGPYSDELAEGFGETRATALKDAKDTLGEFNYELWLDGECTVEYYDEDAFGDEHSDSNHYCEWR